MMLQSDAATDEENRVTLFRVLVICVCLELLVFFWLFVSGRDAFMQFISTPDTPTYLGVAVPLADTLTLQGGTRTLGYPIFLALGIFVGGRENWFYVVIVTQLFLNIGFTWGCWKLLQRLAPATAMALRVFATLFFFWAGLGMALYLMTDFLASLCMGIFLYGLLFWRAGAGILLAGSSLAMATLTRPTFTFLPLLFLPAAYLVRSVTSKVPRHYLLAFTAFSVGATGVSVIYQYTFHRSWSPSPILIHVVQEFLYYGAAKGAASTGEDTSRISYPAYAMEFQREVGRRAGRTYDSLPPNERDEYAKQIFREEAKGHEMGMIAHYVKNYLKYVFVPVESIVMRFVMLRSGEHAYATYVRPVLVLLCLPIWIFSLTPPIGSPKSYWTYYLLVMGWMVYVVGVSAITFGSGERIRFPALMFMMPIMVWNAQRGCRYVREWLERRSRRTAFAA